MTKRLVEARAFKDEPLRVMDVGARGGFEGHWQHYGRDLCLTGFEPDPTECERLNGSDRDVRTTFYPIALHRDKAVRKFHVMNNAASSSFYEPIEEFWNRFPDAKNLKVLRTTELETTDLDSYVLEQSIEPQDFLKLDVEGAEFDILSGSKNSLQSILGLSLEVEFRSVSRGQAPFADIDTLMRESGFYLFDLWPHKIARKDMSPAVYWKTPSHTGTGQLFYAHALYLRDPVEELANGVASDLWSATRLLKMASLMEVANLNDCSAEVIEQLATSGMIQDAERMTMLDMLAFNGSGKAGDYEKFHSRARSEARKRGKLRRKKGDVRRKMMSVTPTPIWSLLRSAKHMLNR